MVRAILGKQNTDMHAIALALKPVEEALHPVPDAVIPIAFAIDHPASGFCGKLTPRHIRGHAALAGKPHEIILTLTVAGRGPGLDDPFRKRQGRVGHHQPIIDADAAAEPATGFTSAHGGVEREHIRHGIAEMTITVSTMQIG